ncbi:MAG: glycosyltransferase family 2 protein [Lacrimispora saccharolytica]
MKYETKRNILLILTMVFSVIYLIWRLFFTLPISAGGIQLVCGILLFWAEAVTFLGTFELYWSKMRNAAKEITPIEIPEELYPHVDVLIATHNEPVDLLYTTVNACTFMEYPDKEKVHIYICDDGNRSEVEKLARDLGVGYIGCPDNQHAKSGNYNHALSETNSPLIVTFDADMIPQRKFLVKTVPYFFAQKWIDEDGTYRERTEEECRSIKKIGLVQTPQSFYNQDLFQYNLFMENNIPNEQDYFSREINVSRNATNSVAYTGSNTILLREAMEEIGGFPYHTITEDFETSIRLQKAGYITYATTEVLAAGLSTTTVASMMKERIRWAQGVIQSIQNTNAVFTKDLPLSGRMVYLNAYLYWWSFLARMIFILAPILFALFGFQLVECDFFELLLFWLPSYLLYGASSRYASTNIRNLKWSQIIDTILSPYLIVPVFLESVGIHQKKFKVTNKNKENSDTTNFRFMIPHLILTGLSVAAILKFLYGKYGTALALSSVIIFWLFYNLRALIFSIFFMMGRKTYRKYERIRADEKVTVTVHGRKYEGRSVDLSEDGIAFRLEKSFYIPDDEAFDLLIETPYYRANLSAQLVYMKEADSAYHYAARVKPVSENDWRQYLQVIHDRLHTHPVELDLWMTSYDDILRNIRKRCKKTFLQQRKALRIPIEREISFSQGARAYVVDFNYHYLAVSRLWAGQWDEVTPLRWDLNGYTLYLQKKELDKRNIILLEIKNMQELTDQGIELTEIVRMMKEEGEKKE